MHTDSAASAGSDAIVASAKARGVPVVSGRQMLEWLDGRNGSSFGSIAWSGNTLTFTIAVGAGANGLRAMVPTSSIGGTLTGITRNGSAVAYTTQVIKGVEYALFAATAGSYSATYSTDSTPPVISGLADSVGNDTATITWTTDEASDSRVDYGTAQASLTQSATNASLVTSHTMTLTGLSAGTTYYYRVRSADAAGNAATSPAPADPPASFTTPPASVSDTTASDFGAGSPGADTYVAETGNGDVILKPTVGAEFSGSALPGGWTGTAWAAGGSATVSGDTLTVDGARAGTDALYGPGRSLEYVATFNAAPNQHIGFGITYNDTPYAIFSTAGGSSLQARTHTGVAETNTTIPGGWLAARHRYRIEWNTSSVVFSIDGAQVASHPVSVGGTLRPLASDYGVGGGALTVDWLRMSPYPASGTFVSRVFDAGATVTWSTLSWTSDTPAGTSVKMSVRTGDTPTPDGTWSAFSPVSTSGGTIGASARYIQYRAEPATTDAGRTPALADVTISYGTGGSAPPPPPPPTPPSNTSVPTITGRAEKDQTLTANEGTWSGTEPIAYAYQWRRCDSAGASCIDIADATAKTYTLVAADVGSTVLVAVTASNSAGSSTVMSEQTAVVTAPPVTVTGFPASTVIEAGSLKSGTAGSLNANDDAYYEVASTTSGTRTTSWYASFTAVANSLRNLKISYVGKNSRSCMQTVAVWRWSDAAWVQLDSRSVRGTEVAVENLIPPGTPGEYVTGTSGEGELRVRVRCSGPKKSFVASGDLMKIDYER
jgi:hypothetical protein